MLPFSFVILTKKAFLMKSNLLANLFFIFFIASIPAQSDINKLSKQQWIEDLDFLINTIKTEHLKPYNTVSEKTLDSLKNDIKQKIETYSDAKIISEFSKITALLKWGHTRLTLPVNNDHLGLYLGHQREQKPDEAISMFSILPLRFVKFHDGVYVESTTLNNSHLLGKRLTHIGDYSVNEALKRISAYISHENESALNLLSPSYLSIVELLYAEGLISSTTSVKLTFNTNEQISLKSIKPDDNSPWIDYLTKHNIAKPLWLKNTDNGMWKVVTNDNFYTEVDQYYWYHFNTENQFFYIKINYLFHHPKKSIAVFMNEAMRVATEKNAKKIILDLRHNRGGSADVNRAVKLALQRWSKISNFGNAFVIVGRYSYSASVLLAMDLEKEFNVIFIGEELGGKPQHIGDSQRFLLPNSKLTLRISIKEHHDWTGFPDRPSTWLHYNTPMTFEDYKRGIDRSLEFAKNYQFKDVKTEIINIYKNTNINVALLVFYHLLTDPTSAVKDYSEVAYSLAKFLYEEEDNNRFAQGLLQYNLEYYPEHISSLLLLGKIQLATKNIEEGKETLNKVLAIDPNNQSVKVLLNSIIGGN